MDELDLRAAFLAKAKAAPYYEPLEIPGIGTVHIKRLNVGEKDLYERACPGSSVSRAVTVVHGCFDDRGARIFKDEDVSTVALMDDSIIYPIVMKFFAINKVSKEDQDELLKNSNGQAVSL